MKKANPVGWFEIPVKDFDTAVGFYEKVFDVSLEKHDVPKKMAFFPQDGNQHGSAGSLSQADEHFNPINEGIMIYFSSVDIDATLKLVEENGGKVLAPKTSIGPYGFVGYFQDTEGNRIGVHTRLEE